MARVLLLAALLALAAPVQAGPHCTLRTLKGDYQIQLLHLVRSGAGHRQASVKGRVSFDGVGAASFDLVMREVDEFGGITSTPVSGLGSYSVDADCRGRISPPGCMPPGCTPADITLVQRGRLFLFGDPEPAGEIRTGFGVEE